MTTAHRATWKAARGGLQEEGSFRLHVPSAAVSAKDAPTERDLKLRPTDEPTSRDELRARLEKSEEPLFKRPRRSRFGPIPEENGDNANDDAPQVEPSTERKLLPGHAKGSAESETAKTETPEQGEDGPDVQSGGHGNQVLPANESHSDGSDSEDSGEEDSDEDEAELLAELERIRKEREFEKAKKQAAEQERQEQEEASRAAAGNPLLANLNTFNDEISETASIATGSVPAFAVRRRWDDDVVFRNQARGERKSEQRFVNDTIRNDFHRRFMKRHMR